jgi:hypothetical protein
MELLDEMGHVESRLDLFWDSVCVDANVAPGFPKNTKR